MKMIKTALLGATFLTAASFAASAADIYQGEPGGYKDAPIYSAPLSWTGFYFGGHLGAAVEDDDVKGGDDTEFLGGIQAGYNWQMNGPWVFGVEGDISFADGLDYLASIRGRLGYAMDNLLVYGTGGAAFIGFDEVNSGDDSDTGWVAGLGAEYKVSNNLSVGVEGLYYSFEDEKYRSDDEFDFWSVRARVSYHLDSGSPEPLK